MVLRLLSSRFNIHSCIMWAEQLEKKIVISGNITMWCDMQNHTPRYVYLNTNYNIHMEVSSYTRTHIEEFSFKLWWWKFRTTIPFTIHSEATTSSMMCHTTPQTPLSHICFVCSKMRVLNIQIFSYLIRITSSSKEHYINIPKHTFFFCFFVPLN